MPNPKHPKSKNETITDYKDYTWVGTVVNVHGIRGELKILPITNTPEYYLETDCFYIEKNNYLCAYKTESVRFHKNQWIVKFVAILDRNDAEEHRGCRVLLEDSQLRPLEEDEYFYHQLVGCQVVDLEGTELGIVKELFDTGASDILVITGKKNEFMVPSIPEFIKEIDVNKQVIRIDPIPGLIEDE